MPMGKAVCTCLQVSVEGGNNPATAVIPPHIVSKFNRVGSVKDLEELKGDLFCLRIGARQKPLTPKYATRELRIRKSLGSYR